MHKIVNGISVELTKKEAEERMIEENFNLESREEGAWLEGRKREYPSISDLVVALWEKSSSGDAEQFNNLEELRQEVKLKYPKKVPLNLNE